MKRYEEILAYWFGPNAGPELWFGGAEETDREIRELFEKDLELAVSGKLSAWECEPESVVALVVLLDQFSLQLFREEPRSYEQSAIAVPAAFRAIERGFDLKLDTAKRGFLYMPFMHAESLELQEQGVRLFTSLAHEAPPEHREMAESFLYYSNLHRDVVRRFGRFPGRNETYGRKSTPEEQKYLDEGGLF